MPNSGDADDADYRISSFSGNGGCVAVAKLTNGDYAVRHSRNHASRIVFSPREWKAFVDGVKDDQFDF